jgi:hypothetical protein
MRLLKLRHLMRPVSHLRYLAWPVAPITPSITIALTSGEKLCLRRPPSTDRDIAYEVFAQQVYSGPHPLEPSSVATALAVCELVFAVIFNDVVHFSAASTWTYKIQTNELFA